MNNSTNNHPLTGKYVSIASLDKTQRQRLTNSLISTVIKFASAAELNGSVQYNLLQIDQLRTKIEQVKIPNPDQAKSLTVQLQQIHTCMQFNEMELTKKLDTAQVFMTEALELLYTPQTLAYIRKVNKR